MEARFFFAFVLRFGEPVVYSPPLLGEDANAQMLIMDDRPEIITRTVTCDGMDIIGGKLCKRIELF